METFNNFKVEDTTMGKEKWYDKLTDAKKYFNRCKNKNHEVYLWSRNRIIDYYES